MEAKYVFWILGALAACVLVYDSFIKPRLKKLVRNTDADEETGIPEIDEEIEDLIRTLGLDTFIGIDFLFELYVKQRKEMLLNQHLLVQNGGTPTENMKKALLINKNVTAVINLVRIINSKRQGRKLIHQITGGYINSKPVEGFEQTNNRKKTHTRDNGKVVSKR